MLFLSLGNGDTRSLKESKNIGVIWQLTHQGLEAILKNYWARQLIYLYFINEHLSYASSVWSSKKSFFQVPSCYDKSQSSWDTDEAGYNIAWLLFLISWLTLTFPTEGKFNTYFGCQMLSEKMKPMQFDIFQSISFYHTLNFILLQ